MHFTMHFTMQAYGDKSLDERTTSPKFRALC